jgi:hypothetical protein
LILTLLPAIGLGPNSPLLAVRVARAGTEAPAESRADTWPVLSQPVVVEQGPDHYPTAGPDGADPNIINMKNVWTNLTFNFPPTWTPEVYKEAGVTFRVARADLPTTWQTVQEKAYPVTTPPGYTVDRDYYKDGLYLWTYAAKPTAVECPPPVECPPAPDLTPVTGEDLGLTSGWISSSL